MIYINGSSPRRQGVGAAGGRPRPSKPLPNPIAITALYASDLVPGV